MPAIDVLVAGAGPAGVLAAEHIAAQGLRVALIDAGPRLPIARKRPPGLDRSLWSYTTSGGSYDWTRVRAIGGRSLLWGGWCARFPEQVFARGGWPYGLQELAPWYARVEDRLRPVRGTLDERYLAAAAAAEVQILPKRAPLVRGGAIWDARRTLQGRSAHSYRVLTRLELSGGGAAAATVVDLRTGRPRRIEARGFVLAASAIETARILLASDVGHPRIGKGLVDHMVSSWVLVEPLAAPGGAGRGAFPGQAFVDRFVNVGGDTERSYPGGFTLEVAGPVPLEALDLERMAPPEQRAHTRATVIHAIGELHPHEGRYMDLDPSACDSLGRLSPRIHVAWTDAERALADDMANACVQLADALAIPGSRMVRFSDPLCAGAGHEAGTCAMGPGDDSPTDAWGRVRSLSNVWIADAAALPTSGDRHPTLTVLAHALRAAEDAARVLR